MEGSASPGPASGGAEAVARALRQQIEDPRLRIAPDGSALAFFGAATLDAPELHWERSPLAHIERARTPTLILHGAADDRVHPEQSLELYTALRIKQVPTQYVLYPREPHGIRERAHRLDAIERMRGWFAKYLAGD